MKEHKIVWPKTEVNTVWIGSYFNHYNAIVIFSEKPTPSDEEHRHIDGTWYDLYDNKKKIMDGEPVEYTHDKEKGTITLHIPDEI